MCECVRVRWRVRALFLCVYAAKLKRRHSQVMRRRQTIHHHHLLPDHPMNVLLWLCPWLRWGRSWGFT